MRPGQGSEALLVLSSSNKPKYWQSEFRNPFAGFAHYSVPSAILAPSHTNIIVTMIVMLVYTIYMLFSPTATCYSIYSYIYTDTYTYYYIIVIYTICLLVSLR